MATCVDCSCKQVNIGKDACKALHEMNDSKVKGASQVLADAELCDYPKIFPKALYSIWCMLKNIIAQICWLTSKVVCLFGRTDTLKTRDEIIVKHMTNSFTAMVKFMQESANYQRALRTLQNNLNTRGYATKLFTQPFSMRDETGRMISSSETSLSAENFKARIRSAFDGDSETLANQVATNAVRFFELVKGRPLVVYYRLDKTVFDGEKLTEAKVTYTLTEGGINERIYLALRPTITETLNWCANHRTTNKMNIRIEFFKDGTPVDISGAHLAFNSLNAFNANDYEGVGRLSGYFITIKDSYIINDNGTAHASGSTMDVNWDSEDNPNFFLGSIIGGITKPYVEFDLILANKDWAWFKLDTNIQSAVIPKEPVVPKVNVPPTLPNFDCDL